MKNLFGFGPAANDGFALIREVRQGRRNGRAQNQAAARKQLEFLAMIEGVTPEQMVRRLSIEASLRQETARTHWSDGTLRRRWA